MCNDKRTTTIRTLNDNLRRLHIGGTVVITSGIRALGSEQVSDLLGEIVRFDAFTPDNDPYDEHDCAVLVSRGHRIIWKIDYYDQGLEYASPDPADPTVTKRVMTVMLSEEY